MLEVRPYKTCVGFEPLERRETTGPEDVASLPDGLAGRSGRSSQLARYGV